MNPPTLPRGRPANIWLLPDTSVQIEALRDDWTPKDGPRMSRSEAIARAVELAVKDSHR
jgi:hypothetical protein